MSWFRVPSAGPGLVTMVPSDEDMLSKTLCRHSGVEANGRSCEATASMYCLKARWSSSVSFFSKVLSELPEESSLLLLRERTIIVSARQVARFSLVVDVGVVSELREHWAQLLGRQIGLLQRTLKR